MEELTVEFADSENIAWVAQSEDIASPFQSMNIKELFEMSTWSLIAKDDTAPKAYAAFKNFPNMHYGKTDWEKNLQLEDKETQFAGLNTLFLHFFVDETSDGEVMNLLLEKTFQPLPAIEFCGFVANSTDVISSSLSRSFHKSRELNENLSLWCCERNSVIPKIGIRPKRSEDYLALRNLFSQIFSFQDTKLREFTLDFLDFGEDSHPTYKYFTYDADNTYICVADVDDGEAVGFIYATMERVNLDVLNENFQLEAAHGLRKAHPKDKPKYEGTKTSTTDDTEDTPEDIVVLLKTILDKIDSDTDNSTQTHNVKAAGDIIALMKDLLVNEEDANDKNTSTHELHLFDNILVLIKDLLGKVDSDLDKTKSTGGPKSSDDINDLLKNLLNQIDSGLSESNSADDITGLLKDLLGKVDPNTSKTLITDLSASDDITVLVKDLLDDVETKSELMEMLDNLLDYICPPDESKQGEIRDHKLNTFINSGYFDISNPEHYALIKEENMKYFSASTLVEIVNAAAFDVTDTTHMKLVPYLQKDISKIESERRSKILNSEVFDPSDEAFAKVCVYAIDKLPQEKMQVFLKSNIGFKINEQIKLKRAISKQRDNIKLSYADRQAIQKNEDKANKLSKREPTETALHSQECNCGSTAGNSKRINVSYRNMGFISGLPYKGAYEMQEESDASKSGDGKDVKKQTNRKSNKTNTNDNHSPKPTEVGCKLRLIIPEYFGDTNCFFVEQLAVEKKHESSSRVLIMAAFDYFAQVDYCVMMLPYGSKHLQLLQSYFTAIPERPFRAYDKELFVFHRSGFNQNFQVRLYEEGDFEGVSELINESCLKDCLLNDLKQESEDTDEKVKAVVLLMGQQVLGIFMVSEMKDVDNIHKQYDIADHLNLKYHGNHGNLLHCVIHPIAKYLSKNFLEEGMRLTQKSILYFKMYPTYVTVDKPSCWRSLCNVLEHLTPLRLTQKHSSKASIKLNVEENQSETESGNYGYSYTCSKWVLSDKTVVSSRVVVIGHCDIALGVLESLIYNNSYRFTNLTIVNKNNRPIEQAANEESYNFLTRRSDYSQRFLDSLCIPSWVSTVKATITSIEPKYICLREISDELPQDFEVGYDYLVLCEDLEFQAQTVDSSEAQLDYACQKKYPTLKNLWEYGYGVKNQSNVFSVNTTEEGEQVLEWLKDYISTKEERDSKRKYKTDEKSRIIVYGNCLNAYVAIAGILRENFSNSKITFVKMADEKETSSFHTEDLEDAVDHILHSLDLEIYDGNLEYSSHVDEVRFVNIVTEKGSTELDCVALVLFSSKSINYSTFSVLHHSWLSFVLPLKESRGYPYLLVNTSFRTNISNIYAAGTIIEMCTETENIRFESGHFNRREIGLMIGENIAKAWNGDLDKGNLPTLRQPYVTAAKLPQEYIYIFITKAYTELLRKSQSKIDQNSVCPEVMVLGNLQTGLDLLPVPEQAGNEETSDEMASTANEDETINNADEEEKYQKEEDANKTTKKEGVEDESDNEGGEKSEAQKEDETTLKETDEIKENTAEYNTNENADETGKEDNNEENTSKSKTYPDDMEYFAITFDSSDRVQSIECFTKQKVAVNSLLSLHGLQLSQLYKLLKIETGGKQDSEKVSFYLTEDWKLPLDFFKLREKEPKEENSVKYGFDGFWRDGFPEILKQRIDTFLHSFSKHKSENQ